MNKTSIRTLILYVAASLLLFQSSGAQVTDPSWRFLMRTPSPEEIALVGDAPPEASGLSEEGDQPEAMSLMTIEDESAHPQIVALARGLRNDPVRIYNYVYNHIQYEHYYGSRRGAMLTLLQRAGNDYDQSALLSALLKAAGHTPTLVRARQLWTFDMFERWYGLQAPFPSQTWTQAHQSWGYPTDPYASNPITDAAKKKIFSITMYTVGRGWPTGSYSTYSTGISLERVWIRLSLNGQTYELDSTLKSHGSKFGPSLSGLQYDRTSFRTAAGGQLTGTYGVNGINEAGIGQYIQSRADLLVESVRASTRPNKPLDEVLDAGINVVNTRNFDEGLLTTLFYYPGFTGVVAIDGPVSTVETVNVERKTRIKLEMAGVATPIELIVSELAGRRLDLTFSGNTASLALEDEVLATVNVPGATLSLTTTALNPGGLDSDVKVTNYAKGNNSVYAFVYTLPGNNQLLNWRQKELEKIIAEVKAAGGYSTDAAGNIIFNTIPDATLRRRATAESLYVLGLQWNHERHLATHVVSAVSNVQPHSIYFFGRVGQEQKPDGSDAGYYVDFFSHGVGPFARTSEIIKARNQHHLVSIFASALEHSVVERSQSASNAVSTVRVMQLANRAVADANRDQMFLFTAANRATVKTLLKGYSNDFVTAMENDAINTGRVYFLPENAVMTSQQWTGQVYAAFGNETLMIISGGLAGGYGTSQEPLTSSSFSDAFTQPGFDSQGGASTAFRVDSPTFNVFKFMSIDPVDMGSGAFVLDSDDLSLGEAGPRGLAFSRSYNSHRRESNPVGLGWGWTHNYDMRATVRSAPEAILGNGTLPQAALFISAAHACADLYAAKIDARDYGIIFMTAGWLVDQIRERAVSITLGKNSLQFVQRPDGSFIPPAKSTLTLTKETNGDYLLKERLGATYRFAAAQGGRCTTVTDIDGRALTQANTRGKHTTVVDHVGRTLTLGYVGERLSTVTDNATPSRGITFTPDGQGNLAGYTDPESKTWHYGYGANDTERAEHQIRETRDPANRLIVTNVYDSDGRVISQRNQGIAEREFKFYWSGHENSEVNPKGEETIYFYDARNRPVGKSDGIKYSSGVANANGTRVVSKISYEGEDLVDKTVDAKGNITLIYHDRYFNLERVMQDASRFQKKYYYDALRRLTRVEEIDSKYPNPLVSDGSTIDRVNRLEYLPANLTLRPDATIDAREVRTEYTYYPVGTAFAGKVHKRIVKSADGDREATHTYDVRGMPQSLSTPKRGGGTEVENYVYSYAGDLTTHTDRRNVTVSTAYNKRRQPYQVTGPGDLPEYASAVTRMLYDDAGNLAYTVDAEGRAVHTTYTATNQPHITSSGMFNGDINAPGIVPADAITIATHGFDIRDISTTVTGAMPSQVTTYDIDGARRAIGVTDPVGYARTTIFSSRDEPVTRKEPLTETTFRTYQTTYTNLGHTNTETDPRKSTSKNFAAWGDLLTLTVLGKKYSFNYFPNGLPKETITPLLRKTSLDYNDRNLLKTRTEPSTQVTTLVYDAADRVETATDAIGTISFAYNGNGQPETVTEGSVVLTRTYDPYGRVKSYVGSSLGAVEYRYYGNGNLKKLLYPGAPAFSVTYEYDAHNRLRRITDSSNRETSIQYRADGLPELFTRPNQSTSKRIYDLAGHLLTIEERTASGALHTFQRYGYDSAFRLNTRLALPKSPAVLNEPLAAMTYDNDYRLLTWSGQSVVHDTDGNMTTGPLPDGSLATFGFNARNQLTSVGDHAYAYDAGGLRVSVSAAGVGTQYTWDPHSAQLPRILIRQKTGSDPVHIVYAGNLPLYEVNLATGSISYFHFDITGNTIAISNSAGVVTDRIDYSPYGTINRRTGTSETPFLFGGAGGVLTDANGLVYMRARYYNPRIGRFLNQDPIGVGGGLNWFAYANANPVMFSDPTGNYSIAYAAALGQQYAVEGASMRIPGYPSSATDLISAGDRLVYANWELAGKSVVGMGGNGAVAFVGYTTAGTGVGAVAAVYASYNVGAHTGNLINAFSGQAPAPTGPLEGFTALIAPDNGTMNGIAKVSDLAIPLLAGSPGGLNSLQTATAIGWRFGGSAITTATTASTVISTGVYGAMVLDAGAQLYDAYKPFFDTPSLAPAPSASFNRPKTNG